MEPTLRELYEQYISVYREDRSEAVKKNYRYNFNKYILSVLGDRPISGITAAEVQKILNGMRGKSATTIRSVYGDLKLVFRHAYIDEYICRDISVYLTKPKCLKGGMRRALTPKEREAVLMVAQTKRKYTAFLFMMLCGARPSEAYAIRKEDIDFEQGTVHIRGTKTASSDRVVPCPSVILKIAEKTLYGLITTSDTGMEVKKETQVRIWHSFFIDCHLYLGGGLYRNAPCEPYPFGVDLTAYNLRHEYCTELARRGVDLRITQKLMGHSSPEMTLKVYTNLSSEDINTEEIKKIINNSARGSLQDESNVV